MLHVSLFFNLFLLISAELDRGYGYQTGHISMNDSEITILINSTFEIIEDFDNETDISASRPAEATEDPKKSVKLPVRMKKLRPATTSVQCQKYSEAEKYQLLESAGGRNQMFMADSIDEASQNFADSFPANPLSGTLDDAFLIASVQQPSSPNCDSRCQAIKTALNSELLRRSQTNSTSSSPIRQVFNRIRASVFSDAPPTGPGCSLGNFIPVGACSDLGESVDGGTHESLCSECRGLYMLNGNCFPKIFNTVQCNSQEMGCIFDTFTDKAHGQCGVQTLSFKVLRNTGDENCEDWIVEQIQLPVACQCSLSKSSFLRAKPNKEL